MRPSGALRHPLALVGGMAVSLALFWLMVQLVTMDPSASTPAPAPLRLERLRLQPPPTPAPPSPGRPTRDPVPPTAERPGAIAAEPPPPAAMLARVPPVAAVPMALHGLGEGGSGGFLGTVDRSTLSEEAGWRETFDGKETIPIASARPKYPRHAAERGLEGWVEVLFTIGADGRVHDVSIIDAEPRGVFEAAAATAVSQWVFSPLYRGGQPVLRQATQRLEFTRADIEPLHLLEE